MTTQSFKVKEKAMATKGKKSLRNQAELYDEVKKAYSICLTPTGIKELDFLAKTRGLSRSELIERIARGEIKID